MREWLSGGASPCQGEGRGFDPRLALFYFAQNAEPLHNALSSGTLFRGPFFISFGIADCIFYIKAGAA